MNEHNSFKEKLSEFYMECVILCGGKGARLKELTEEIPKSLIKIGDKPILLHLIERYSNYGFKSFILCVGYKGEMIKKYFEEHPQEDLDIQIIDTGNISEETGEFVLKAERLKKIKNYLKGDTFFVSYGDDLADVDLEELLKFHKKNGKIGTITAVHPNNPYGILGLKGDLIEKFIEKPPMIEWVNGGYMVLHKKIFDYIKKGQELENEVFRKLVIDKELCAFKHSGFWKSMNTFKDVKELNELWRKGNAKL